MSAHASKGIRFLPKMPRLLGHAPRCLRKRGPRRPPGAAALHRLTEMLRIADQHRLRYPRHSTLASHICGASSTKRMSTVSNASGRDHSYAVRPPTCFAPSAANGWRNCEPTVLRSRPKSYLRRQIGAFMSAVGSAFICYCRSVTRWLQRSLRRINDLRVNARVTPWDGRLDRGIRSMAASIVSAVGVSVFVMFNAIFAMAKDANERPVSETNDASYHVPFTSGSSLLTGLHVSAALGGGAPHTFLLDTGSVGVLTPRAVLGADYQKFDPSLDTEFRYVSSGKTYFGQWVEVPLVLGVPAEWDGTGDYPVANVEVFAVDRPVAFDGGLFGVGFGIGGRADGGPERNPILQMRYHGARLRQGYIVSTEGVDVGLTAVNTAGFAFITLDRDGAGRDWRPPNGSVELSADFSPDGLEVQIPVLMDTGIKCMILWVSIDSRPPGLTADSLLRDGVSVRVSVPAQDPGTAPPLQYAFVTGDASQPMAPSEVEWRVGHGINTGRNVLAGADYLYDAMAGRVGFRVPPR
jgi:hypothetical protein